MKTALPPHPEHDPKFDASPPDGPPSGDETLSPGVTRRWDWQPKLRWFAAEYLIVVLGVLTAVGINAWWSEHQRADAEQALIAELREDVEDTRVHTQRQIGWHQGTARGASAILNGLSDGVTGIARDTLLTTVGSVLGSAALWQPTDDTYTEALGSGRLALITDPEVRSALSHYHVESERMGIHAAFVTARYLERDEPFLIENSIYSEVSFGLTGRAARLYPDAPYRTNFEALAANPELWNLLSIKLLIANGTADELVAFDSLSVDLLRVLDP